MESLLSPHPIRSVLYPETYVVLSSHVLISPISQLALPSNEEKENSLIHRSLESGRAPSHDLALAHQLCVELGPVEGEVDIEVDAVEGALRSIHPLKVLLEVFP
jgi:hypothetical protein